MKTIEELKGEKDLPMVLADEQGLITYVNVMFQKVFGWQSNEVVGRPLTTIIPPNLRDAHHMGFSRFLVTGKPTLLNQPLKLKAIKKDGTIFDAEHFIVAERIKNNWVFGATIQPLES